MSLKFYNKESVPNAFGIVRVGLLCYLNAFLQSFLSCSRFNIVMLEQKSTFESANNTLALSYITLLQHSLEDKFINVMPSTEHFLRDMLSEIQKQKKVYQFTLSQQGTHEFMTAFIDILNNKAVDDVFTCIHVSQVYCNRCNKYTGDSQREKVLFIPHENQIYKKGLTKDEFMKKLHTKVAYVADYKCSKCQHIMCCFNIYKLVHVPEVLCIFFYNNLSSQIFHREDGTQYQTTKTNVYFPDTININKKMVVI